LKVRIEMIIQIIKTTSIFLLAGLCEIGGGYLVWQWLKEDKPVWYGILGGIILALYGVVATLQTSNKSICNLWRFLYRAIIVVGIQI
jgi:drug/metabolite transporter superfamily protein YnfA